VEAVIDIKQEELDSAFLDGAVAADDAILSVIRGHVSPAVFEASAKAVYDMLIERVGKERMEAVQGPQDREVRG
jgi:hypothetical protein